MQQGATEETADNKDEITTPTDIEVKITSPKIIFDEYLFGEKVLNQAEPAFFLLNMGTWQFSNKVYSTRVEKLTDNLIEGGLSTARDKTLLDDADVSQKGTYESLDMKFLHLSMHYSPYSARVFLDKAKLKTHAIEVFKNMNLGFQLMTLLKEV